MTIEPRPVLGSNLPSERPAIWLAPGPVTVKGTVILPAAPRIVLRSSDCNLPLPMGGSSGRDTRRRRRENAAWRTLDPTSFSRIVWDGDPATTRRAGDVASTTVTVAELGEPMIKPCPLVSRVMLSMAMVRVSLPSRT